jgi:hypothetical protein
MADPNSYLSFALVARWSGVAFIKIPDSATPFTVGELWLINADGSQPLSQLMPMPVMGFAASWSPDGALLAYVVRGEPGRPGRPTEMNLQCAATSQSSAPRMAR